MGYKGPKIARFLHPSGFREYMVFNVADLAEVDANTQAIRIAHTVGKRKRADIIAKAKELNLKILNVKLTGETEEESQEETTEEETDETKGEAKKETKADKKPKKEKKPVAKKKSPKKDKTKTKKGDKKQ